MQSPPGSLIRRWCPQRGLGLEGFREFRVLGFRERLRLRGLGSLGL